jgi:hypothetical protein
LALCPSATEQGVSKILAKGVVQIIKYRGATKRWHRGEIGNIVAQQKDGIVLKSEILRRNKRWRRVAIINIVKQ